VARPHIDRLITPTGVAICPWSLTDPISISGTPAETPWNANALTHLAPSSAGIGTDPQETFVIDGPGKFVHGGKLANSFAHQFMFLGYHTSAITGKTGVYRAWLASELRVKQALSGDANWCEWLARPAFEITVTANTPQVLSTSGSRILPATGETAFCDVIALGSSYLPSGAVRVMGDVGVPAVLEVETGGADYILWTTKTGNDFSSMRIARKAR